MILTDWDAEDAAVFVESRRSLQVGDYCQPMVYDGTDKPGCGHRVTMLVVERNEAPSKALPGHVSVIYKGVDCRGEVFDFWPMDDPRRSTEAEWRAEYDDLEVE